MVQSGMAKAPPTSEDVSEEDRGALGLEIMQDKEWVDVTILKPDTPPPPEEPPQEDPDEDSSTTPQETLLEAEGYLDQHEVCGYVDTLEGKEMSEPFIFQWEHEFGLNCSYLLSNAKITFQENSCSSKSHYCPVFIGFWTRDRKMESKIIQKGLESSVT